MELARRLREEAVRTNQRRLLVLTGSPTATRERAVDAMATAGYDSDDTVTVGPTDVVGERYPGTHADELLGRTLSAVVYDAHGSLRPNALGQAVGAVAGGGLVVLLAPPLAAWPETRDEFDETLAVPPCDVEAVEGNFRTRVVETLRAHRGVALVDADDGTVLDDGATDQPPRPQQGSAPPAPSGARFPAEAYETCRTGDQAEVLSALEHLADGDGTVVVEADRGRGKSSVAGLAAASLAASGADVLVTAPEYSRTAELFARARSLLSELETLDGVDDGTTPRTLRSAGRVRFAEPIAAAEMAPSADAVVVDEAAALPVRLLESFLDAPAVAYTTTIHGYEGAGRGFSVRFSETLAESDREVDRLTMHEPIRYAPGDPVEVWATRALLLDARPAVDQVVGDVTLESATYDGWTGPELLANEHRLREVFGLLVLAHYRTEPNDLARLLDAPNVAVRALVSEGHVVSVALLAREGGLDENWRERMYRGERIHGNMLPDVLTTQLRDEAAGESVGWRVLRIATHPAVRSRGLGSALLSAVAEEAEGDLDWVGVGFGATPALLSFWADNGYRPVHLSTTRNARSGEHSAIMLRPVSSAGQALLDRHLPWFRERLPGTLSDALADVDVDVIRATLATLPATGRPSLSDPAWRLLAGTPYGAGMFDTAPDPYRTLALHALADDDGPDLSIRTERLLAGRCLQGRTWGRVADGLGFPSERTCMQALGDAIETLVEAYGTESARAELERLG